MRLYQMSRFLWIFCLLCSCHSEDTKDILAEAYGETLFISDIKDELGQVSQSDSLEMIQKMVDDWIEEKVILEKAAFNLSDAQNQEIEQKLTDYKNSLLVYEYEKALLQENMDTLVHSSDIDEYYVSHKKNFKLNEYICRFVFLKVPQSSSSLKNIRESIKLKSTSDSLFIQEIAQVEAEKSHTDYSIWKPLDVLIGQTPIKEKLIDKAIFLKHNKVIEIDKNDFIYFIHILDYKSPGTLAPLPYTKEQIKLILRNLKKSKILKKIRQELVNIAISKNDVLIHDISP